MAPIELAAAAVGGLGFLAMGYKVGSRCNHEWEDRGWSDQDWDMRRASDAMGDAMQGNSISRGMTQRCQHCGSTRVQMREIGKLPWKEPHSETFHDLVEEELIQ